MSLLVVETTIIKVAAVCKIFAAFVILHVDTFIGCSWICNVYRSLQTKYKKHYSMIAIRI
jgi:hypothetical protein